MFSAAGIRQHTLFSGYRRDFFLAVRKQLWYHREAKE